MRCDVASGVQLFHRKENNMLVFTIMTRERNARTPRPFSVRSAGYHFHINESLLEKYQKMYEIGKKYNRETIVSQHVNSSKFMKGE